MSRTLRTSLLSLFVIVCLELSANAANITASTSGDWTENTTWIDGVVPSSTDSVIIPSNVTVTVSALGSDFAGIININGGTLTVTNSIQGSGISGPKIYVNDGALSVGDSCHISNLVTTGVGNTITIGGKLVLTGNSSVAQGTAINADTLVQFADLTLSGTITLSDSYIDNGNNLYLLSSGSLTVGGSNFAFLQPTLTIPASGSFSVNDILFLSSAYNTYCYNNLSVCILAGGSDTANVAFEYTTDGGTNWNIISGIVKVEGYTFYRSASITMSGDRSDRKIGFRIRAKNEFPLNNLSIINTYISANQVISELDASTIAFDNPATEVCADVVEKYSLIGTYDSYSWTVVGGDLLSLSDSVGARIKWNSTETRNLTVSLIDKQCAAGSKPIAMTAAAFKVSEVSRSSCYNDMRVKVKTECSTVENATIIYTWYKGNSVSGTQIKAGVSDSLYHRDWGYYTVVGSIKDSDPLISDTLVINMESTTPIVITPDAGNRTRKFCASSCDAYLVYDISGGNSALSATLRNSGGTVISKHDSLFEILVVSTNAITDYQLQLTLPNADYPYQTVRFFADKALTQPLNYWISSNEGTNAVFYVKTDIIVGNNSIYMIAGEHSFKSLNGLQGVADNGFYVSNTITTCIDNSSSFNYTSGVCDMTFNKASAQTFIWKGWYSVPSQKVSTFSGQGQDPVVPSQVNETLYLKVRDGNVNSTSSVVIDGTTINAESGKTSDTISVYNLTSYCGKTVEMTITYTKPQDTTATFGVAFSSFADTIGAAFSSNILSTDEYLNPSLAYSFKQNSLIPTISRVGGTRYTELCAGKYTYTVTDGTCTGVDTVTIPTVAPIKWTTLPDDYQIEVNSATNQSGMPVIDESFVGGVSDMDKRLSTSSVFGNENNRLSFSNGTETISASFNAKDITDIAVSLTASQSAGGTGWTAEDYILIEWSADGGSSYTTLYSDAEVWNGDGRTENNTLTNDGNVENVTYTSGAINDGVTRNGGDVNFVVRVTFKTNSPDKTYFINNLKITGTVAVDLLTTQSGTAVASAGTTVTYCDSVALGKCGNGGMITRIWTAYNDCEKIEYRQILSFFESSKFPGFADTPTQPLSHYGYCKRVQNLTVPKAKSGLCEPYTVYYILNGADTVVVYSGNEANQTSDATTNVSFPMAQTSTFIWGIEDAIGTVFTDTSSVNVSDSISGISFNYDRANICGDSAITVTVNQEHGVSPYTYGFSIVQDPVGTLIAAPGTVTNGDSGKWSTTIDYNTKTTSEEFNVKVTITDSDGCEVTETDDDEIEVHPNISTNRIKRG